MWRLWTQDQAIEDALAKHPNCTYAIAACGLTITMKRTHVVNLWRNEECYLAKDPCMYVCEGYLVDNQTNREILEDFLQNNDRVS